MKNKEATTGAVAVGLQLLAPQDAQHNISARESFTIGRSAPADLVIDHTAVSCLHARIEGRKGRLVLTDGSGGFNGSLQHIRQNVQQAFQIVMFFVVARLVVSR